MRIWLGETAGAVTLVLAGCGTHAVSTQPFDAGADANATTNDPCSGVTCNNHGCCAVAATPQVVQCICDAGYTASGLTCGSRTRPIPAGGVTCGGHGTQWWAARRPAIAIPATRPAASPCVQDATTGVTPKRAFEYQDTIGINGYIDGVYGEGEYLDNRAATIADAVYIGATKWRNPFVDSPTTQSGLAALAAAGFQFTFTPPGANPLTVEDWIAALHSLVTNALGGDAGSIRWLEGPNEPDHPGGRMDADCLHAGLRHRDWLAGRCPFYAALARGSQNRLRVIYCQYRIFYRRWCIHTQSSTTTGC